MITTQRQRLLRGLIPITHITDKAPHPLQTRLRAIFVDSCEVERFFGGGDVGLCVVVVGALEVSQGGAGE